MRTILHLALLSAYLAVPHLPAAAAQDQAYKADAGSHAVDVLTFDWRDESRDRDVPVKIYLPKDVGSPAPVIVMSHGLGGSRDGYEYLGRHWASHGYVSVHPQHIGSDASVWQTGGDVLGSMRRAAANPQAAIQRPQDVRFVVDKLETENAEGGALAGRLDLSRLGMAGHSFGAYTTMAVAGQVFSGPLGRDLSVADTRFKAAIPMSSPVRGNLSQEEHDTAYGKVAIPCLHMTGTLDDSPVGDTAANDRRRPFDHSRGPDKYLVVFEGGDHMIFSGRPRGSNRLASAAGAGGYRGDPKKDATFQRHIRSSSTAFWDAYLRGDPKAKAWLADGGFETALGGDGTFEKR